MTHYDQESDDFSRIEKVVSSFRPRSNVVFEVQRHPVDRTPTIIMEVQHRINPTDKESLEHALATMNKHASIKVSDFDRDEIADLIQDGRRMLKREKLGIVDMTARSYDEVEEELPGLSEWLDTVTGKVLIIGNGLSPAAAEMIRRFPHLTGKLVLIDAASYPLLLQDLTTLKKMLDREGVPSERINQRLKNCQLIMEMARRKQVHLAQFVVGKDKPTSLVSNAEMGINCFGPPKSTVPDQIDLLQPGGALFAHYTTINSVPGTDVIPVTGRERLRKATIFVRHEK